MKIGKRFSQLYLERGTPGSDSVRFRRRLGAFCNNNLGNFIDEIPDVIHQELGVQVPLGGLNYDMVNFFIQAEIRDVLDSITIIYNLIERQGSSAKGWRIFVQKAFREENLAYKVDEEAVVHFLVDEEFERNRVDVLKFLDTKCYASVKAAFEDAHRHLDTDPIDTKASVRSIFESLEILAKLMIPNAKNLNKRLVQNDLKESAKKAYKTDKVATKTINTIFTGLGEWVDALHNYRHGQGTEEPIAPPLGFAIYIFSAGASFLRWLLEIDAKNKQSAGK